MTRESIIELQKIDCNCNDCKRMNRDVDRFKKSLEQHYKWQLDYFNTKKNNLLKKAYSWKLKGDLKKHEIVKKEANKMKFQFDKKDVSINYGDCLKYNKKVSFIPNTCQIDTQHCFEHRRIN